MASVKEGVQFLVGGEHRLYFLVFLHQIIALVCGFLQFSDQPESILTQFHHFFTVIFAGLHDFAAFEEGRFDLLISLEHLRLQTVDLP